MADVSIALPGYFLTSCIYDSSRTAVYRGQRQFDEQPVTIKLLKSEYPARSEILLFRNQYTLTKNLDLPGIVQSYSLENYRNSFALVMEDFGGISLQHYTSVRKQSTENSKQDSITQDPKPTNQNFHPPLPIDEFFNIAIQVVQTLEGLYYNHIIHKDIKPQNILINPDTFEVKLIDFSIASRLPRENQIFQNPNCLEGTLAYISPEQTGRMNRGIDYRTDFYSLGVTFYELLTGQLPFLTRDPMEIVHCHIARVPPSPIAINPTIPKTVADLVMKLMAKTPEERYQSASGILYDLENCWQQWATYGSISAINLGQQDISDRFTIPEKLYGRETEVVKLMAAFERVSQGNTEMVLVAGFSGIGKSALVKEIHKPIVRQRGYFITGKFDQFKRNTPFCSLIQAFRHLVQQLLTESNDCVAQWQIRILDALGTNGQAIADVIPEVELLIGKQPDLPELEPTAAQNRFRLVFEKFIRVFATADHPLVIFLDDLQWADSASLQLMELLLAETDTRYLLLVGAYRDNEVTPTHPLILTLEAIQTAGSVVSQITLSPLSPTSLNQLIADTLHSPPKEAVPLTDLIVQKTQGNPFFTNQFLKFLHQEQTIFHDPGCGYWQYDLGQAKVLAVSGDVVEFIALQLQKLPNSTQAVLKFAACIGNHFDLHTLAIVYEKSLAETAADLWQALQEGIILPINEVYKLFQLDESEEKAKINFGFKKPLRSQEASSLKFQHPIELSIPYKFLHDRVQQAAYFLIPDSQKHSTHLKVGRLLLNNLSTEEREEKIFEIVNHLNVGSHLILHQNECYELARLNLLAARKAKDSTAYVDAMEYVTAGLEFLAKDSWTTQYDLTLSLHETAVEIAYLRTNFEQMEQWIAKVLQHARTLLNTVKVYEVKIQACIAQNQLVAAVKTALKVLKLLGVQFPEQPSKADVIAELQAIQSVLSDRKIDDLIDLPAMTDPVKLAAIGILARVASAAYHGVPDLLPLIVLKQTKLSIIDGNAPVSPFAYASYGFILCTIGEIETGYRFSQLAFKLLSRFKETVLKARTIIVINGLIRHWKEHVREELKPLQTGYQSGLETGDFDFSARAAFCYCSYSYYAGKELITLEREIVTYSDAIGQIKQETSFYRMKLYHQAILNLISCPKNPYILSGKVYDEQKSLLLYKEAKDRNAIYHLYINKLILSYLFGEFYIAANNAILAGKYLDNGSGSFSEHIFYFYGSLAQLAIYPDASEQERIDILEKVAVNQEKMHQWSQHAPMNFLHKFHLVEAEKHRILDRKAEAMDCYDRSITLARENEYIQEEALANELAARFFLAWDKSKIAQVYLTDAYYGYVRWGAQAKVADLTKRYAHLLLALPTEKNSSLPEETVTQVTASTVVADTSEVAEMLDLAATIKASQAISGTIHLDQLLATLMQVAIEHAGAEQCWLILPRSGTLTIEAQGSIGMTEATVLQSIPIESSEEVPVSLIHYVERTQEILAIHDARTETTFAADPYMVQKQPKSVLCLPIRNQGKLIGILYLENNLIAGAFTSDRLEVLQLLTAQAAISLENAMLYEQLEDYLRTLEAKVQERTEKLQREVRDRKRAEENLHQAKEAAVRAAAQSAAANRAKSEFLANMSHELRTPLNAILGFTQLMVRDLNSINLTSMHTLKEYLEIVSRSGEHLLELIDDVLEMSKIEAGRTTLNESHFDLYRLLDSLENMLQLKASSKELQLLFERDPEIPQFVQADERKLRQILINLLGNAIKFTETGSVTLRVKPVNDTPAETQAKRFASHNDEMTTNQEQLSMNILFEVEDTGPGIAAEEIERLFEAFVQTETGRRSQTGTGLGLPISQQFARLMGGDIIVNSVVGQGTIFKCSIQAGLMDGQRLLSQLPDRRIVGLLPNQPTYRILVVEDKWANRQLLVKMLEPLGFEVREAENGQDAIAVWQQWQPHLIWMDMRMPIVDGYEATRQIKAREKGKDQNCPSSTVNASPSIDNQPTIVIALTASAFEEDRAAVLFAGCDDFVRKPFREEAIFETMAKHLGVRYLYAEKTDKQETRKDKKDNNLPPSSQALQTCQIVMATMPSKWVAELHQAAQQVDAQLILQLLDRIPEAETELTHILLDWVNNFRFDKIIDCTNGAIGR